MRTHGHTRNVMDGHTVPADSALSANRRLGKTNDYLGFRREHARDPGPWHGANSALAALAREATASPGFCHPPFRLFHAAVFQHMRGSPRFTCASVGHAEAIRSRRALVRLRTHPRSAPHVGTDSPGRMLLSCATQQGDEGRSILREEPLYRFFTRDSGQLLADDAFMQSLPIPDVPVRVYAGTAGYKGRFSPFKQEDNDGILAVSETPLRTDDDVIRVPTIHTFIMN